MPTDLWPFRLLKRSLTQSSLIKGRSSSLWASSLISGAWDSWGWILFFPSFSSFLHLLHCLLLDPWGFLVFFLFSPLFPLGWAEWASGCAGAWLLAEVNTPPFLMYRISLCVCLMVQRRDKLHTYDFSKGTWHLPSKVFLNWEITENLYGEEKKEDTQFCPLWLYKKPHKEVVPHYLFMTAQSMQIYVMILWFKPKKRKVVTFQRIRTVIGLIVIARVSWLLHYSCYQQTNLDFSMTSCYLYE